MGKRRGLAGPMIQGGYGRSVQEPGASSLRDSAEPRPRTRVEPHEVDELATGIGRRIVCAACGHPITTDADRIAMNGAHEHTCVNPHDFVFHIGCFGAAPGCRPVGVPTTDFTWFPGFAWSYALCGGCRTLLGWHYQGSGEASFFGLILDRIRVAEGERD